MMHDEELYAGGSHSSGVISRATDATSTHSRVTSSESDGFDDANGWNAGMCAEMEYFELFEDPQNDCGVYAAMVGEYDTALRDTQPDWRWVLSWLTQCVDAPQDATVVAGTAGTAGSVGDESTSKAVVPAPIQTANPPGSAFVTFAQSPDGQRWKLLESPATRRLKSVDTCCTGALFPIDVSWNRKDLQQYIREHALLQSLVEVDNLFVGYHFRDSAGLALALCDGTDRIESHLRAEVFLSALTESGMLGGRLLQVDDEEDLRPFYRVDRVKQGDGVIPPQSMPDAIPKNTSLKTHTPLSLHAAMRDVRKLSDLIAAHGGLTGCRFVAFDCEAAIVAKGSVALPLELSFVDCLSDVLLPGEFPCPRTMHVDPGVIDEEDTLTSRKLSTCSVPGGHGLPLRHYQFLSRDYTDMANDVHQLLFPQTRIRKTILINKGSTMDLQAIRWLYAVDAATREHYGDLDTLVPRPSDVAMFDITCLQEVLGVDLERDVHRRFGGAVNVDPTLEGSLTLAKEEVGRCWYHGDIAHVFPDAHCALKDARALAAVVGRWLI